MVPLGTAAGASAIHSEAIRAPGRLANTLLAQRQLPGHRPCWRCSRLAPRRRRQRAQMPRAALLDPPPFDPAKLSVEYLPGGREPLLTAARRYTLTHNDVTGSLQLSIGREYNRRQLSGWYTRILRDEILAEWQDTTPPLAPSSSRGASSSSGSSLNGSGGTADIVAAAAAARAPRPSLHVYCHVSGEELWPAPPQLRSFIFQREMALVLDTIWHAERQTPEGLLTVAPHLAAAPVYVHLRSDIPALDRVVEWGVLGDRSTWRTAQSSIMRSLLSSVLGTLDEADLTASTDGSNGSWSPSGFSSASSGGGASWGDGGSGGGVASWDGPAAGPGSGSGGAAAWGASWDDPAGGSGSDEDGSSGGGSSSHAGCAAELEEAAATQQQQQQQRLPEQQAEVPVGTAMPLACSSSSDELAASQVDQVILGGMPANDSGKVNSTNGAGLGAAIGGPVTAANGAVSLVGVQQAAECSWLAATTTAAAADGRQVQRMPASNAMLSKAVSGGGRR